MRYQRLDLLEALYCVIAIYTSCNLYRYIYNNTILIVPYMYTLETLTGMRLVRTSEPGHLERNGLAASEWIELHRQREAACENHNFWRRRTGDLA